MFGPLAPFMQFGPTTSGGGAAPATPSLSVAANGDGTATATITGSASGSSNVIDVAALGSSGAGTWSNAGSRTGDGDVTLTLSNGSYLATCESTLSGVAALAPSNPFTFTTSGGTPATVYHSPHAALAHAVQASVVGMLGTAITGVPADSVRVRKVPDGSDFTPPNNAHALPAILIVYSDRERDQGGVNDRDDIGYPLTIVFAASDVTSKGTSDPEANDDLYLTWRQKISDVFRNQPYTITNYSVANPLTFQTCALEYGPIVDWSRWQKDQIFVGSMTLVFELRKQRGPNPSN